MGTASRPICTSDGRNGGLQYSGDVYFEIDPLIIEDLDKFLLEKALKIVYKKQDYLKLDRLLKITFP